MALFNMSPFAVAGAGGQPATQVPYPNNFQFQNAPAPQFPGAFGGQQQPQGQGFNTPWGQRFGNPTGGQQQPNAMQNIYDIIRQQMQANQGAANANTANFQQASNQLLGTMGRLQNDPVFQATRQNVLNLQENPYTINDEVKQLTENRASNLINAAIQGEKDQSMGQLALDGRLGGSAQNQINEDLFDKRIDQLTGLASNIELQAAERNGQDLERAINLGQNFSQFPAGLDLSVGQTLMQNLPQVQGQDFSALLSAQLMANQLFGGMQGQVRDGITDAHGRPINLTNGSSRFNRSFGS